MPEVQFSPRATKAEIEELSPEQLSERIETTKALLAADEWTAEITRDDTYRHLRALDAEWARRSGIASGQ